MKKILFIFVLFFTVSPSSGLSAGEFSLDDLFRIALERSEIIKIAEEDLYLSGLEKNKALAVLFPKLSAFGEHIRYSEEKRQTGFLLQPDHTNEWGFRLDETLSLGGKQFTTYKITKEGAKKSGFDLHAIKENYLFNVATQYYIVLRAKKGGDIARVNVQRLIKHRDAAKTRLEVGEATKTALLRAEAELAGARSDLIKAENNLQIGKTTLAKTVGLKSDYDVQEPDAEMNYTVPVQEVIDAELSIQDCQQSAVTCLKEVAMSERAELKSMAIQKSIAEKEIKAAKSSYWPDIAVEGVYFRQENEPSSSFGLKERIYGGLRVDFPFFEGGLRLAEVSEAKAKLRQAEYSLTDLGNTIRQEVENSYLMVTREASVLKHLSAEAAYAMDNFNSVSKQFQFGLTDSVDVMDANTLLVTSERELANAEYTYQLAILRLKRVTGILLKTVISNELRIKN
jgi:outer membrane protein